MRVWITCLLLGFGTSLADNASAATIRLAASTPLSSYADPLSLDVGTGILPSIMDGVTRIGPDGAVMPALALAWRTVADDRWVFELRPNVVFSDAVPFDAAALAAYVNLLAGPEGRGSQVLTDIDSLAGARVLGPLTVEIATRGRDVRLPRKLSRARVFNVEAFRRMGRTDFARQPIGTGPYRAESWSPGGAGLTLIGVPTSWRAPPQIDRVEVKVIPDRSVRLQSLLAGETDIASNLDPDSIETLTAAGMRAHVQSGPIVLALAFRTTGDASVALRDRRVRRAFNMAVDRVGIAQGLLNGTADIATQVATPDSVGYDAGLDAYPYDPEAARALMAAAGYGGGFPITIGVFGGQFPGDTAVFQRVAQELAAIGVKAEVRQLPFPEFSRRTQSGDWDGFDMFSSLWLHYSFGDISRSAERHSCLFAKPWFCEPELTPLIAKANEEFDEAMRAKRLQEVNAAFHEAVPSLLLTRYAAIDGLSRRVERYVTLVDAILFNEMRVAE